ncbi:hypothetical protein [Ralstonia syzygii]|uniref:hypothetical protein n=1 Tax=Ralstonia syzygii TaxID=28097 RepID=UPI001E48AC0E|nr:hypothetical protein [Ralstonia syzygii]
MLATNTTLTTPDIEENAIGDQGARRLAASKTRIALNVRANEIGHAGGLALAVNETLVSLAVGYNGIGSVMRVRPAAVRAAAQGRRREQGIS